MDIQISTDRNIKGGAKFNDYVEGHLQDSLGRFESCITRLIVHFTDENSAQKAGDDDKRCVIEARIMNAQPITVSHQAPEVDQALAAAVEKLEKTIDHKMGRRHDVRGRSSAAGEQAL